MIKMAFASPFWLKNMCKNILKQTHSMKFKEEEKLFQQRHQHMGGTVKNVQV
jgi:hypothetical protein